MYFGAVRPAFGWLRETQAFFTLERFVSGERFGACREPQVVDRRGDVRVEPEP